MSMTSPEVNAEALLCAFVLAPGVFSRNRFFELHRPKEVERARRRARRLRGILQDLAGMGRERAQIVGERTLEDGRVLLRYELDSVGLRRSISLSPVEAATLRFALAKAGVSSVSDEERRLVIGALKPLGANLVDSLTSAASRS